MISISTEYIYLYTVLSVGLCTQYQYLTVESILCFWKYNKYFLKPHVLSDQRKTVSPSNRKCLKNRKKFRLRRYEHNNCQRNRNKQPLHFSIVIDNYNRNGLREMCERRTPPPPHQDVHPNECFSRYELVRSLVRSFLNRFRIGVGRSVYWKLKRDSQIIDDLVV